VEGQLLPFDSALRQDNSALLEFGAVLFRKPSSWRPSFRGGRSWAATRGSATACVAATAPALRGDRDAGAMRKHGAEQHRAVDGGRRPRRLWPVPQRPARCSSCRSRYMSRRPALPPASNGLGCAYLVRDSCGESNLIVISRSRLRGLEGHCTDCRVVRELREHERVVLVPVGQRPGRPLNAV